MSDDKIDVVRLGGELEIGRKSEIRDTLDGGKRRPPRFCSIWARLPTRIRSR